MLIKKKIFGGIVEKIYEIQMKKKYIESKEIIVDKRNIKVVGKEMKKGKLKKEEYMEVEERKERMID